MSVKPITVDERPGAWWVTLDRPPLNVLDIPTIRELHAALLPLPARRDVKALVFRSGLEGTFSAGVDIKDHTRDRVGAMLEAFHAVFRLLDTLPQATLAAVDGRCLGGGCELAVFCDVVLATPRSTFGQPEIDVGCFPPVAAALLPRLVGRAAYEIVLGGASIGAVEAAHIGLISRVTDDVELEASRLASIFAAKSGDVLSLARKAMRGPGFTEALNRAEAIYRGELASTHDMEEGVRAFLEKRPPRWRDG